MIHKNVKNVYKNLIEGELYEISSFKINESLYKSNYKFELYFNENTKFNLIDDDHNFPKNFM